MIRNLKTKSVAGVLALTAAFAAAPAFAEEKAPQVFRASFIPAATEKFLKDNGFPFNLTNEMKRDMERAPFLAPGAVDLNRPIGVLAVISNVNPQDDRMWVFRALEENFAMSIPVNKGFATPEAIAAGFAAHGEQVQVNGNAITADRFVFHRLADNLIMARGPAGDGIIADPLAGDYKNPGTLASVTIDLATLRKKAEKVMDGFWSEVEREASSPNPIEQTTATSVLKAFRAGVDAVDSATLVISHDDKALRAVATLTPVNVRLTTPALPKPTFPDPQAVELHILYPNVKTSTWAEDAISSLDFAAFGKEGGLDTKQTAKLKEAFVKTVRVLFTADATSIGVTVNNGMPLVLALNQYAAEVDVTKELKEIAASINAIAKELGETKPIEVSEYTAGDQKVSRVLLLDNEKPEFYIDFAQKGKRIGICISAEKLDGKAATVLAAPTKGNLDHFVSGTVNLGDAIKMLAEVHAVPRGGPTKKLVDALAGKVATLDIKSDETGKSMVVEGVIAIETLKAIGNVVGPIIEEDQRRMEEMRRQWEQPNGGPGIAPHIEHMPVPPQP